ncbi:MAG: 3-oxoacyl-[acyl-carrier-protein] reductase [Alphaproteobacteria bacterium]|nr:3-oxoacyl-[acyl-carrier-protein] reductase [Alphaproteobacteria bacterium]
MFDLSEKVALITGATGAIGKAIAKALHSRGAIVALSGTKAENLEILAREFAERVFSFACNLGSPVAIEELVANVNASCGKIDILVNNAGITRDNLMVRMSDQDWADVLSVNLEAPFRLMKLVAKGMMKERWGRIINVSSIVGAIGNPGQSNYAASKAGLFGLTKSVAAELAKRNITVNCIAPGFIASPMSDKIPETQKSILESKIPMGRIGQPEEVASAVCFLASKEASYVTGHVLHVNGGLAMI